MPRDARPHKDARLGQPCPMPYAGSGGKQEIHGAIAQYCRQDDQEKAQQGIQVDLSITFGSALMEMSSMH